MVVRAVTNPALGGRLCPQVARAAGSKDGVLRGDLRGQKEQRGGGHRVAMGLPEACRPPGGAPLLWAQGLREVFRRVPGRGGTWWEDVGGEGAVEVPAGDVEGEDPSRAGPAQGTGTGE